ncbi:hypothetical protein [Streptomyces sp. NPDC001070]
MSDHDVTLVEVSLPAADAPNRAVAVRDWLLATGAVVAPRCGKKRSYESSDSAWGHAGVWSTHTADGASEGRSPAPDNGAARRRIRVS